MERLRKILSVTAIRLSIAYTVIFSILAIGIVVYMTSSTANLLRRQIEDSVDQEVGELALVYEVAGINGLMRRLERSAAAPGANLYVVADPSGLIFAGNVRELQAGVIDHTGWSPHAFEYQRFEDEDGTYHAVARVVQLPNGMRLLVGRDLGEPERFRAIVRSTLLLSVTAMALLGLLTWILVGRRALKRLDSVSRSTSRIMAGDRRERLPVSGTGDEFDTLSERLNAMLDRIGLLDEGLKQVSDNIAHDLKTPLTRLRNKADRALASRDGTAQQESLQEIVADIDGIIRTFDALLMISRVESGSAAAELTPQDLGGIMRDVAELYEPLAEEEGVTLTMDIADGIVVCGNRELLAQAIANLVDNALKYGRSANRGSVRLTLRRSGADAIATVADSGPGIPAGDRGRVVERFARLEMSRNRPGNGLGLSLVRAVALLHSGVLEFSDNKPGLSASIRLPLGKGGA